MSLIIAGLLGAAKIAGGILVARTVGKGIDAISERIIPYQKTRSYKQTAQSFAGQKELEKMREAFQQELQQANIQANKEIAIFNQYFQRQTTMLLAEYNTYFTLRHILIQDAIRNFPLNISPLVLLENNNIDVSFLLGQKHKETDIENNGNSQFHINIIDKISNPRPLNVFVTPMHIDARVGGKETIGAQVFDSLYSSIEAIFVNEYSRNGERPVIMYATAWNKNVKGGMHAADELYYFLKDMPTIVVEPRFDGKTIKLLFTCWGIGYSQRILSRQEMQIPLDINSMLTISVYERSKKAWESLSTIHSENKVVIDQIRMYEHNISLFDQLNLGPRLEKRLNELTLNGKSAELDELGDYSKLFFVSQQDITNIADTISATTGMMISALADTHHLLANDVTPRFPYIYKKYFADFVDEKLLSDFGRMYERTYLRLKDEFPTQEPQRLMEKESVMKLLGCQSAHDSGYSEDFCYALKAKCEDLGVQKVYLDSWSVDELINFYIEHIDPTNLAADAKFRKSLMSLLKIEEQKDKLKLKMTKPSF